MGRRTYDPSKVGSYDWASNGKQTGITHEHTLSASGGTDKFQGYASFGYLNQKVHSLDNPMNAIH